MRTGTETGKNQSQSRTRTVKTTWRNWRQRLMRLMFFDAFVHGWGRLIPQVSSWETWTGAKGLSTHLLASPVARWRLPPSLVAQLDGLVAAGSGALASPFPSPALSLCLDLCAVCPSRPAWLALAPTPLSSAAAPCRAPALAPARAPAAGAPALGLAPVPARALAVCSLALFPFPVPGNCGKVLFLYIAP